MRSDTVSIGLLADFNVQNLSVLLQKSNRRYKVDCAQAPFGQTSSLLLDHEANFWLASYDAVVLWTMPERAVPSFIKVLGFEEYSPTELLREVGAFAELVERISEKVHTIIIPSWVAPGMERGWGALDLANGVGISNALMRMNLALADRFEGSRRVVLLDADRWMRTAGAVAFSPKLWYLSKTPYHRIVFQEAATDILAAIDGVRGHSKKIVILDLDNTLWGGIVGDLGWEKLRLGGHDSIGEAHVDFQKALKRLTNRGVVLAVVSKNEESIALEAIRQHPEMVLRTDDFAGWRINWGDKAKNIVDLLSELNLGLESAVFLDDSPFERARVREALPQVLVPDLPEDPTQYAVFLSRLSLFDNPAVSAEDRRRNKMYIADRERIVLRHEIASLDQWLKALELNVCVERLDHRNLERAAQLLNKTNQMNLKTRRMTASELMAWAQTDGHIVWTFRVWDRFGDYGLCGISSLAIDGATGQIEDFLLSCRVMTRGVENAMLATVAQYARDIGCDVLLVEYSASPKNSPCRSWLESTPSISLEGNRFMYSLRNPPLHPDHIRMSAQ